MENEQLTLLKQNIEDRIKGINGRRLYYRGRALFAVVSTALLAALSAVLLGLNLENWSEEIRIAVLIITSIISLINVYNAFFNYKDLWIANNTALNKFYELKFSINFAEKGEPKPDGNAVERFRSTYQQILNELNQTWLKTRTDSQDQAD